MTDRELMREFGIRLKRARKDAGLTQDELAGLVGIGRVSITNMERGHQNTTLRALARLATALDCNIGDLLPASEFPRDPAYEAQR